MKVACVSAAAVVAISMAMARPALADSNGVTIYCGVEGTDKVLIKADNKNPYPMKCNVLCTVKREDGEKVEVKITDQTVAGPDSTYQTLLEKKLSDGTYMGLEHDYSCSKP